MGRLRIACLRVAALCVFAATSLCLALVPFDWVARAVRRFGKTASASGMAPQEVVQNTYRAVLWAARFSYRRRRDCLSRALATFLLLRIQGCSSTLWIGAKKFPFESHAWVECDGLLLDEWPPRLSAYIPLAHLP